MEYQFLSEEYKKKCEVQGTQEVFNYDYKGVKQECLVYLPYDYSKDKNYKFVYLMHGGGGNIHRLFRVIDDSCPLQNALDHMFYHKEISDLIIVCPTYFGYEEGSDEELVKKFSHKLTTALLTSVENHYGSQGYLTREERVFGGYSMGAVTTYWQFIQSLDYFKYFIPMSGECWVKGQLGGGKYPKETAYYLANYASNKGLPFEIYQFVGEAGIAYQHVPQQIEEMYKYKEVFNEDNLKYFVSPYVHDSIYANEYLYNALPLIFK